MDICNSPLKEKLSSLKDRACSSLRNPSEIEEKINADLKHAIHDILYDLMFSADVTSAVASVKKNKLIDGIEFTKRALLFGIEKQPYEQELISRLLSGCYEVFNDDEIEDGFQLILYRLPDVVLDVPFAPQILSKFISRAIYDEIIPPIFVKDAHVDNKKAKECMSLAFARTHSVDNKESNEHIWGPGDLTSVVSLKVAVDSLLDEYFENPGVNETTASFMELNVPSFFGEIIKRGVYKSISLGESTSTNLFSLLVHWTQINLISESHIKRGFNMSYAQLADLKIDVPNAGNILSKYQNFAIEKKLLPPNFIPVL